MSVVDQLKNLFSKKSDVPSTQNSGELSLAMPDQLMDRMATRSMGPTSSNNAISMGPADPDSLDDESTRLEEPGEADEQHEREREAEHLHPPVAAQREQVEAQLVREQGGHRVSSR